MKKVIVAISVLLFSFSVNAQSDYLLTVSETKSFSEKITNLFYSKKILDATKELRKYWPIPEDEIVLFEEKTVKYLNLINERFGSPINYMKVKNETILDFAIRETYLIRYDNTAIRIIITFYKSKNGWIVNAFKWDDSFTDEFK